MLQVFILFYRKQHMKALLEYLLDSSVIILLHDLQRRKNILMVIPKQHDWCTMTGAIWTDSSLLYPTPQMWLYCILVCLVLAQAMLFEICKDSVVHHL